MSSYPEHRRITMLAELIDKLRADLDALASDALRIQRFGDQRNAAADYWRNRAMEAEGLVSDLRVMLAAQTRALREGSTT